MDVMEQILQFGPDQSLVGVLTSPDCVEEHAHPAVAYILFNSGVISRVGPHRNNVRLARAMAEKGKWVLRFDLSGHGDSRPALSGFGPREQAVADLKSAMDCLSDKFGIDRFCLIGLCSGAVHSYWTALQDARVVGLFMMDGFWYRTWLTKPIQYWKRVIHLGLIGVVSRVFQYWHSPKAEHSVDLSYDYLSNPPKVDFVVGMGKLVERGVKIKLLYSGSVLDVYSYAKQFQHAFGRHDWCAEVTCSYRPDIDHTLISKDAQRAFIDEVGDWAIVSREAS